MAIEPRPTKGGIVVLWDTKKNELAGSIGQGKDNGIPTVGLTKTSKPAVSLDDFSLLELARQRYVATLNTATHQRYLTHLTNIEKDIPSSLKGIFGREAYDELAYELVGKLPTDLDDIQLDYVYGLLLKGIKNIKPADAVDPTDEQWAQWIAKTEARILSVDSDFDTDTKAQLLAQLDTVKNGKKPDGMAFVLLNKVDKKAWAAKYDLDQGYKQISAWFDVSPVDVKWQVAKFRKEYLEAEAAGNAPEIPALYNKGYKGSSGSGPKDNATVYGHWMAENPELYDESAVPTRFVAFDTETTGLDSRTANVIQIGMVEYDHEGNETRRYVTYIRPPLDAEGVLSTGDVGAVEAHQIMPADVVNAPTFPEAMSKIKDFFEGATVIGQNVIKFDSKHLAAEYIRASDGDKSAGNNLWNRAADTLWYAQRHLDKDALGLPNHKLVTLNDHFGLPPFDAHDAGADAHATGLVFFHIRREMKKRQRAASKRRRESDFWTIDSSWEADEKERVAKKASESYWDSFS